MESRSRIGLVTDSTACIPPELVAQYGIEIVPVELAFEGKVYRDGVDLSAEEFYQMLKKAHRLPTTSPASPVGFLEAYRRLGQRSEAILCLTVAARFSAMFDSARAAMETAREAMPGTRIEVLDSGVAAMCQGFMVLEAARAAAQGKGMEEVIAAAQRLRPRVQLLAMLDTLYYLAKGGRVPIPAAWASSLLQVKPILELREGELRLLERVRTRPRAIERMVEVLSQRGGGKPLHLAVVHAHAIEEAMQLKERLARLFPCRELYLTQFTPVMGVHTGPGLLGLAFYTEE